MAHKQHILIVDDNFINRQFFSMTLKKASFNISTAQDGYDAIDQAKLNNFDLILMDIRMPGIDGYETAKQIRRTDNHKNTPILATSAEDISQERKSCFNGFFMKPISPKLLSKEVSKSLSENTPKQVIFNQDDALKFAYNDKDIMNKLINLFVLDLPLQIAQLETAFIQKNTNNCIDIIHKIRGSCKACGAQELNKHLKNLSANLKNKGIDSCSNDLEKTKNTVNEYLNTVSL